MTKELYKLRIVADTEDDIFLDLLIDPSSTFIELHKTLVNAFQLGNGEMASFYVSNSNWDKGEEIPLINMFSEGDQKQEKTMDNSLVGNYLNKENSKMLYLYDFLNMNIFYLELVELGDIDNTQTLPKILYQFGNYIPKSLEISEDTPNSDGISNELQDIFDEYDENEMEDFDELDENIF